MTTETTLEALLKEGEPSTEVAEVEEVSAGKEETAEKVEEAKAKITFSPDQETEIQRRIDSERDLHTNKYREQREADVAYIKTLNTQLKEARTETRTKQGSRRLEAILSGDREEGLEQDKIEARQQVFGEFNGLYQDYKANVEEVNEAAKFIADMTAKQSPKVIKEFGLDDANPNIRAVNGAKFLDETIAVYKYTENFLMALEDFLPRGDELRKQIEEIVDGMAEFNDDKSKKLYIKDKLQGVKRVPGKKPATPSDTSGGVDLSKLSGEELLARGYAKQKREGRL